MKLLISLVFSGFVYSSTVLLTEDLLVGMMDQEKVPELAKIQAGLLNAELDAGEFQDKFSWDLSSEARYQETREQALLQFIPVFSPIKTAQIAVTKPTRLGSSARLSFGVDQRTTPGLVNRGTTSIVEFALQMDMWKDLFGRMTRAQEESLEIQKERAKLEYQVAVNSVKLTLRRYYWSLVANNDPLDITRELYQIAERQEIEAKKRQRSGIADLAEVSLFSSQTSSRFSNYLSVQHQRERILRSLKNILPELSGKNLELAKYDIEKSIKEVLSCTSYISAQDTYPFQNTPYDEIIELLRKYEQKQLYLNSFKQDIDLKLVGAVRTTGVENDPLAGGSLNGSVNDFRNNNRTGMDVGLSLNIPFGSTGFDTRETKKKYIEKMNQAQYSQLYANIRSEHDRIKKTIPLLLQVIAAQQDNTQKLKTRLKEMKKKYKQARISVTDLINDQDSLLSSQLAVTETRLEVVNGLIDYLLLYPTTPCAFNRI